VALRLELGAQLPVVVDLAVVDELDEPVLGGDGLPEGGLTTLVYQGADPGTGEQTPNEFVVPFETARAIAREFFRTEQISATVLGPVNGFSLERSRLAC